MVGQEVGRNVSDGVVVVRVSARYYRPAEVDLLCGNPAKAVARLGWNPQRTSFQACTMTKAWYLLLRSDRYR